METAFVTGGSGFVGRNLIVALRSGGRAVRALARSDAAAAAVRAAGAEPVKGDLDDEAAMRAGMEGAGAVFHAAAFVKDWGPLEEFLRVTVGGTERVIAAARAAKVPRLVHVSTEAVLVDGTPIVQADETRPLPRRPIGLYPWSKGLAEERVRAASGQSLQPEGSGRGFPSPGKSLDAVVVRPRLIWGKGDTTLLPEFVKAVHKGKFAWIAGGRYLTSTCHVRNVCEGAIKAAERGKGGEVYFLTDGPPIEMRAFLTALLATQGIDPGGKSVPRWVARAGAFWGEAAWRLLRLKGQPPVTRTTVRLLGEEVTVSDAKARRDLGYEGSVTREAGLAEMRSGA